jgi:hypothetical protein
MVHTPRDTNNSEPPHEIVYEFPRRNPTFIRDFYYFTQAVFVIFLVRKKPTRLQRVINSHFGGTDLNNTGMMTNHKMKQCDNQKMYKF